MFYSQDSTAEGTIIFYIVSLKLLIFSVRNQAQDLYTV